MTKAEIYVYNREMETPGTVVLKSGWPDFLVVRSGEVFAIEVKRPADRVSPAQSEMHAALRAAGLRILVEVVPGSGGYSRSETSEIEDKIERRRTGGFYISRVHQAERALAQARADLGRWLAANPPPK